MIKSQQSVPLTEVTQTPCSNNRPCPDGGPCLEYGGTYLCTCQTGAGELDHKDIYPYGKSLRRLNVKTGITLGHDQPSVSILSFYVEIKFQRP